MSWGIDDAMNLGSIADSLRRMAECAEHRNEMLAESNDLQRGLKTAINSNTESIQAAKRAFETPDATRNHGE